MKFEISRTSAYTSQELPCEGVIKEYTIVKILTEHTDVKTSTKGFGYNYYTKNIGSLEELMDFIKNVANNKVVIQWNEWSNLYEIEIYDDWRE